ncbi:MAG: ATP-binding protein [Kiritimatiellae bacterium]|nr:ATP-binding protein [Kiritimatiellia bacterium]
MTADRSAQLQKLLDREGNGLVKIVTGVRRCGKSFLLFRLFRNELRKRGVKDSHVVEIALDDRRNAALRDPDALFALISSRVRGRGRFYVLLDEVQMVREFEDVLSTLLHLGNAEVYVTGSNSRFLSTDVVTEFRGRGDEIRIHPLRFSEFLSASGGTPEAAWKEFATYGGMPHLLSLKSDGDKADYLSRLVEEVYLSDIADRHGVRNRVELDELADILASGVGSYTSALRLAKTFRSAKGKTISEKTVAGYIRHMEEAFLVAKAARWDVRGKKYMGSPAKWYYEDVGLRNARLNFRQQEETHIMENVVFNDLVARGCRVDVGVVEVVEQGEAGGQEHKRLEVDFVVNRGMRRWYVQSAFAIPDAAKRMQETRPFKKIPDAFSRIVVVKADVKPWIDEDGVLTVGLFDFLLDDTILERGV